MLGDLLDRPPELVLAAVRLCRELTAAAAAEPELPADVAAALRATAESADALLRSAG